MNADEWEKTLVDATKQVWQRVAPLAKQEVRGEVVGTGAAGDATIFADKMAEDLLLKALEGVSVLTEEAGAVRPGGSGPLAVVDPLDGSSNFSRGVPFYCTSVAIAEGGTLGGVWLGVVRDLVTGDVYCAQKGKGATKNGVKIKTSRATSLQNAVAGVDLSGQTPDEVARLSRLIGSVKRHLHLGANALEICLVADGTVDAFVDVRKKIRVTDVAAACLIAEEAGATVSDGDGSGLDPALSLNSRLSVVVSAGAPLHGKVLELLRAD